jgi:hypothetical protein
MAGVMMPTVKELMGHKNINMTLGYPRASSGYQQNAVNAVASFGAKVPSSSTTGDAARSSASSQVVDFPSLPR